MPLTSQNLAMARCIHVSMALFVRQPPQQSASSSLVNILGVFRLA